MMTKQAKIKLGDIVILKSGGPRMTVSVESGEQGKVGCLWMEERAQAWIVAKEWFPPEALIRDPNPPATIADVEEAS